MTKLPYVTFNVPLLSRLLLGKIYAISIGLAICEALGVGSIFSGVCYFQRGRYSRSVHTSQYVAVTRRYDRPFLGKRSCHKLQQHVGETDRFVCTGDFLRKSDSKTEFCSLLAEVSFVPRRERPLLAGKEFCRATNSYTKSFRKSPFEFVRPVCLFVCFFYFKVSKYTKFWVKERKTEAELLAVCRPTVGRLSTDRRSTDFFGNCSSIFRSSSICAVWDVTGHRKKH